MRRANEVKALVVAALVAGLWGQGAADDAATVLLPDPSVFAENGKYYLIGTENGLSGADGKPGEAVFPMFVSDDLVSFRKAETGCAESRLLPRTNAFGKDQFWAPQIFRHKDLYCLAYTSDLHWGLAVSDRVGGPYRAHAEFPKGAGRIDPFVFVDDDGRVWAYFSDWNVAGGVGIAVVELTKDLKSFADEPALCVKNDRSWERTPLGPEFVELNRKLGYRDWQAYHANEITVEGPTVLKRNGKYVLFYSANDFRSPDYCVCAAVADTPRGPWKKLQEGPVLSRAETGFNGTGHGDVFFDRAGAMWYVFHVHNSPTRIHPRRTGVVRLVETVGADGYPRYAADRASVRLLTATPCVRGNPMEGIGDVRLKGGLGGRLDAMIARHVEATDVDYITAPFLEKTETKGWWQTEFWGKWMHSAAPYARYANSARLRASIDRGIDRILASQEPNGYIGNYPDGLRCDGGWDVWGMKYTLLGLIHYCELVRDEAGSEKRREQALSAAKRLCDYVIAELGPGGRRGKEPWQTGYWSGLASSSILEPVMWLHRLTGEKKYLDFATCLVKGMSEPESGPRLVDLAIKGVSVADRNGYGNVAEKDGRYEARHNRWKAYEMMSCYQGLVEYFEATGREDLLRAAVATADDIVRTEINLAGGCASSEAWYRGAERQHLPYKRLQETCVTTTWMRFCAKLLEVTGDPKWADQIERTFYNAYLAAMKSDGAEFAGYTPLSGSRYHGQHHCYMHTDCCNANGPRGFLCFLREFFRTDGRTATFNFYGSALVKGFDMYSLYPRTDWARIVSHTEGRLDLRLRIPAWSAKTAVKVNGVEQSGVTAGTYFSIDREWKLGDVVEISFDMPVVAHGLEHSIAFTRGPILLARDSRFNDGDLAAPFRKGLKDGQTMQSFVPVRTTSDDIWMEFAAVLPIGEHSENPEGANGLAVRFCDYASAGNTWRRDDYYRTWFPVEFGPEEPPQGVKAEQESDGISPIVSFLIPAGRPDEAECRRLVKTVADAGFDQVILYPSTGLDYDYLGEDYFRMYGAFADEIARRGMKLWLYDEFNWPSGSAFGRVPAEDERFLYRELVASTNDAGEIAWTTLASRGVNVDNGRLDTNNWEPDGVRRFMELTHFAYERHFKKYMGSVIRGIFTDEPGHCSSAWRLEVPKGTVLRLPCWSGMEEEYRLASGGGDLRKDFERAFRKGKAHVADVMRTWVEIRSRRYRASYFDPIAAWCRGNGIDSCGHLIGEDGPCGCAYHNGLPLNTLRGLTKPGIDLIKSGTDKGFEWITLAFAQAGARYRGKPGMVELFALGPCDLTFTAMRKLYWICALHGIDTYFQSLYHHKAYRFDKKDSWAMFTSPTQPWFREMPLLHETAKEAARWARKTSLCDIAVVYPQRQLGASWFCGGPSPDLRGLCAELTWNQFNYDLVEEDEATERAVVLDWDGEALFERRTGTRFGKDLAAAVKWLEARFPARPRVKDAEGRTRPGFVTRAYADGSAVAVDATTGEVIIAPDGNPVPREHASAVRREQTEEWTLSLSGPSRRRMWFWTSSVKKAKLFFSNDAKMSTEERDASGRHPRDNMTKVTLTAPLKGVKFALRCYPADRRFSVTMDGRPLAFPKPCTSVAYAFDDLYRETEPMDLAAGEHVFELSGGNDGKMFMPVMWMVGDFAEREYGVLSPLPKSVRCGALAEQGLGSFAGVATYRAETSFASGERLRIDSGGAVARVRFGGRDLGARGWAPFEWTIPAELTGRRLPLEIDIVTSVRPIFGSEKSPDAKLDHALWVSPSLSDSPTEGLLSAEIVHINNRKAVQ